MSNHLAFLQYLRRDRPPASPELFRSHAARNLDPPPALALCEQLLASGDGAIQRAAGPSYLIAPDTRFDAGWPSSAPAARAWTACDRFHPLCSLHKRAQT